MKSMFVSIDDFSAGAIMYKPVEDLTIFDLKIDVYKKAVNANRVYFIHNGKTYTLKNRFA